jgi:DNA topoisomerase IB
VLAAQALARGLSPAATARDVAEHLGNTPAVARGSYIDPRVFERTWTAPVTEASVLAGLAQPPT